MDGDGGGSACSLDWPLGALLDATIGLTGLPAAAGSCGGCCSRGAAPGSSASGCVVIVMTAHR